MKKTAAPKKKENTDTVTESTFNRLNAVLSDMQVVSFPLEKLIDFNLQDSKPAFLEAAQTCSSTFNTSGSLRHRVRHSPTAVTSVELGFTIQCDIYAYKNKDTDEAREIADPRDPTGQTLLLLAPVRMTIQHMYKKTKGTPHQDHPLAQLDGKTNTFDFAISHEGLMQFSKENPLFEPTFQHIIGAAKDDNNEDGPDKEVTLMASFDSVLKRVRDSEVIWTMYAPADAKAKDGDLFLYFHDTNTVTHLRVAPLSDDSVSFTFITPDLSICCDATYIDFSAAKSLKNNSFFVAKDIEGEEAIIFSVHNPATEPPAKAYYERAALIYDQFLEHQADPYVNERELENLPTKFLRGSQENLEQDMATLLRAAIPYTHWAANNVTVLNVNVDAASEDSDTPTLLDLDGLSWSGDPGGVMYNALPAQLKEGIAEAAAIIAAENEMEGYTWIYNDGPYDRISGYDRQPYIVKVAVAAPSAHEFMDARVKLKAWAGKISEATMNKITNPQPDTAIQPVAN